MKIAYIRPRMGLKKNREAMEPLSIASIHATAPSHHQYEFYDEMLEDLPSRIEADIAALTVQTFSAARAYGLADKLRKDGMKVVMGGPHPTLLPDEALQHADAVAVGGGEHVWSDMLRDAESASLKSVYQGAMGFGEAGYNRSIYSNFQYLPVHPVEFQRGCPWNCDFCSVPIIQPGKSISRKDEEIVQEIQSLKHRNVLFVDDNLLGSIDRLKRLLELIRPLKLRWGCQISMNVVRHPGIVDEMARSGCIAVLIGFESISTDNLKSMNKLSNFMKDLDYNDVVKRFHDAGIFVYGSFIFGYDDDTADTMNRTMDFALNSKLLLANFNTLTPMPGTALYSRLLSEGRLIHTRWWCDSSIHYGDVVFRPVQMEPDELKEKCISLRRIFYSSRSLMERFPYRALMKGEVFKLFMYITSNIVTSRSIADKMSEVC